MSEMNPPVDWAEKPCVDCGTTVRYRRYWDRKKAHGRGGYGTIQGYCGGCRVLVRMTADGTQKSRQELTTCPNCGGVKSPRAKRCKPCANAMSERRLEPITATCQFRDCGQEFTYTKRAYTDEVDPTVGTRVPRARKYCSLRCGNLENKRRRADQYKANGAVHRKRMFKRNEAQALAFRHGYLCHICGELIDVSLGPTDRMGLTVDHVVPLARGGTDDEENLRPAHRSCNSSKGHR